MCDLISRHDALNAIDKRIVQLSENPVFRRKHAHIDLYGAKELIRGIPSAEPKTGEWIILDECANDGVYCSRCHKKVFKIDYSNTMKWKNFNFCPNCGADMRGEKDEHIKE